MKPVSEEAIAGMERLARKAFKQSTEEINRITGNKYESMLSDDVMEKVRLHRKVDTLLNRHMSIGEGEFNRLLAVLNLSAHINTWAQQY